VNKKDFLPKGKVSIGLTSGASTPDAYMQKVRYYYNAAIQGDSYVISASAAQCNNLLRYTVPVVALQHCDTVVAVEARCV
jgi:hypothetical protein